MQLIINNKSCIHVYVHVQRGRYACVACVACNTMAMGQPKLTRPGFSPHKAIQNQDGCMVSLIAARVERAKKVGAMWQQQNTRMLSDMRKLLRRSNDWCNAHSCTATRNHAKLAGNWPNPVVARKKLECNDYAAIFVTLNVVFVVIFM